jgi:DNA-binding PadR family transcriptional regulator
MTPVFGHGRLRLYLLKLLDESPRHGYEIIQQLRERFAGLYSPSAGTVYPRLARLETEGLIRHETDGGRKVYQITDAGRAELAARAGELEELESEIRASARDLAEGIRQEVRESAKAVQQELADQARRAQQEERGEGSGGGGPWSGWAGIPPWAPQPPAPPAPPEFEDAVPPQPPTPPGGGAGFPGFPPGFPFGQPPGSADWNREQWKEWKQQLKEQAQGWKHHQEEWKQQQKEWRDQQKDQRREWRQQQRDWQRDWKEQWARQWKEQWQQQQRDWEAGGGAQSWRGWIGGLTGDTDFSQLGDLLGYLRREGGPVADAFRRHGALSAEEQAEVKAIIDSTLRQLRDLLDGGPRDARPEPEE